MWLVITFSVTLCFSCLNAFQEDLDESGIDGNFFCLLTFCRYLKGQFTPKYIVFLLPAVLLIHRDSFGAS